MRRRVWIGGAAVVLGGLAAALVVGLHDMTNLAAFAHPAREPTAAGSRADAGAPGSVAARLAGVAGHSTLRLTHHGRTSGKPYEVTIWFVVDGDTMYLTTMDRGRQWVRNVTATPEVQVQVGGQRFAGTVSPVITDQEMQRVYGLLVEKYWVMWLMDRITALTGHDARRQPIELGAGGFFHVHLRDA